MCPLATKVKGISRFTWKIHTGACPFAICSSESACWESPLPSNNNQPPLQKPKHQPYPCVSICCMSGSWAPFWVGTVFLDSKETLNYQQGVMTTLLTSYLEHYLPRSNYRLGKKNQNCKSTSSPEMLENDGSSFQHGKWKLPTWTFSKP